MRKRTLFIVLLSAVSLGALAWVGCGRTSKSTTELIADLKSSREKDRIIAVRLLPQHKRDAAQTVPALIDALKDKEADIRWSAAIGLGYQGESAREAIPALQKAQHDPDARVREGASVALSRIDPEDFPVPTKGRSGRQRVERSLGSVARP